jgi:hypothetical protein
MSSRVRDRPLPMLHSTDGGDMAVCVEWAGGGRRAVVTMIQRNRPQCAQEAAAWMKHRAGATWLALDEGLLGAAEGSFDMRIDPRSPMRIHLATAWAISSPIWLRGACRHDVRSVLPCRVQSLLHFRRLRRIAGLDAGCSRAGRRGFRVEEGAAPGVNRSVVSASGLRLCPPLLHTLPVRCNGLMTDPVGLRRSRSASRYPMRQRGMRRRDAAPLSAVDP